MLILSYIEHMYKQKVRFKSHNVLKFFSVLLCTDYLPDLIQKFQVASTYDTSIKYKIWSFCFYLFLKYADKRYKHTNIQTYMPIKCSKCDFGIKRASKCVNSPKFLFRKLDPKTMFSILYWHKKAKTEKSDHLVEQEILLWLI